MAPNYNRKWFTYGTIMAIVIDYNCNSPPDILLSRAVRELLLSGRDYGSIVIEASSKRGGYTHMYDMSVLILIGTYIAEFYNENGRYKSYMDRILTLSSDLKQ